MSRSTLLCVCSRGVSPCLSGPQARTPSRLWIAGNKPLKECRRRPTLSISYGAERSGIAVKWSVLSGKLIIVAQPEKDLGFLLAFVAKRSLGGRVSSHTHKLDRLVRSSSTQAYRPEAQPGQAEWHLPLLCQGQTLFAQKIYSLSYTLGT